MRAARFLTLTLLLVAGLAGGAAAQSYSKVPGVYPNVGVGIVPAGSQGGLPYDVLPSDLPELGPTLYRGTLTIVQNIDGTSSVSFQGEGENREKLNASALFSSAWVGVKRANLVVGTSLESDVITGIDGAHLLAANINGVGKVDGAFQRIIAKFTGDGSTYPPSLTQFKVLKAPGFLR